MIWNLKLFSHYLFSSIFANLVEKRTLLESVTSDLYTTSNLILFFWFLTFKKLKTIFLELYQILLAAKNTKQSFSCIMGRKVKNPRKRFSKDYSWEKAFDTKCRKYPKFFSEKTFCRSAEIHVYNQKEEKICELITKFEIACQDNRISKTLFRNWQHLLPNPYFVKKDVFNSSHFRAGIWFKRQGILFKISKFKSIENW